MNDLTRSCRTCKNKYTPAGEGECRICFKNPERPKYEPGV